MRTAGWVAAWLLAVPAGAAGLQTPSSAEACGDCHRAIFQGWKKSAHAAAMESRLFQDALRLAGSDYGAAAQKICLSCHSPVGTQLGDADLIRKVSWEGITCDYCHSIREVVPQARNFKARIEFSQAKSGPSKDAVSPAHATVYSAVHETSLTCAICHEYVNGEGFAVLTTYSEWKASAPGKAGKPCQSCHMRLVEGSVVDPRIKRDASETVNLHQMPGSHSVEQLTRAVSMQMSAGRDGDAVAVTIKLANAGAGHSLPTGSPLRRLILEVRADSFAGANFRERRVYARTVADAKGEPILHESDAFMKAAKEISDTRIGAGETRTEKFSFAIPKANQARVTAQLFYYYSPTATTESEEKIMIGEVSRMLP